MGKNSSIEWTDHTFNPWMGCTRVSDGCVNCYADTLVKRFGKAEWGPTAQRVRTSDDNWREPFAWNRKAMREGVRYRVFCASLADVFEDNDQVVDWRLSLFGMMQDTPNLDWLLLTKRPENVNNMVPAQWRNAGRCWPENVWVGTTVENQEVAYKRIQALVKVPSPVRFLSCEPLLGPLDLRFVLNWKDRIEDEAMLWCEEPLQWVIAGGESGSWARPMHPDWVRSLRDQCVATDVPFLFKQWGQYAPAPDEWYGKIVRIDERCELVHWKSKHDAGRELDGRTWDQFPVNPRG